MDYVISPHLHTLQMHQITIHTHTTWKFIKFCYSGDVTVRYTYHVYTDKILKALQTLGYSPQLQLNANLK